MEQVRLALDGFVAPFEAGGKEPRQRQTRPPRKRCHRTEVQRHKQDGAQRRLSMSLCVPDWSKCQAVIFTFWPRTQLQRVAMAGRNGDQNCSSSRKTKIEYKPSLSSNTWTVCRAGLVAEMLHDRRPHHLRPGQQHMHSQRSGSKSLSRQLPVPDNENATNQSKMLKPADTVRAHIHTHADQARTRFPKRIAVARIRIAAQPNRENAQEMGETTRRISEVKAKMASEHGPTTICDKSKRCENEYEQQNRQQQRH